MQSFEAVNISCLGLPSFVPDNCAMGVIVLVLKLAIRPMMVVD